MSDVVQEESISSEELTRIIIILGATRVSLISLKERFTTHLLHGSSASLCSRDAFACWAIASQTQPPVGIVTPRLRALCAS